MTIIYSKLAASSNELLRILKQMAASKPTVKKSRQNQQYAISLAHNNKEVSPEGKAFGFVVVKREKFFSFFLSDLVTLIPLSHI